jgi:hypothetical protein
MKTIDQAGQPAVKRAPTQEDIKKNPEAYRTKAPTPNDNEVQTIEGEQ